MNEQDLRRLVRDVIARHGAGATSEIARSSDQSAVGHASHAMFRLPVDPQGEGRCVIEPAVMCNHCGFCKSWGH